MKIIGISAYYHDSAACIVCEGKIIAAVQEERFTRVKQDASFPKKSIEFCLNESGFSPLEIDAVVFYDKPLLKFERLLETYYAFAPKGLKSFLKAMPIWIQEKLFLKSILKRELLEIGNFDFKKTKILFTEHHLSHAASAFYASPFKDTAILTLDGVGEWATCSISKGLDAEITMLKEMHFPHSLGLLYSSFTYFLGFKVNEGEYKLMGLAPYGQPNSAETQNFISIIKEKLVTIYEDGSIFLEPNYFTYSTSDRMISDQIWNEIFGMKRREKEEEILQTHCNLAFAIQSITEEIVLLLAKEAKRITGSENLCLAGGVALNCVANGKLLKEKIFKHIFIQPAAGDAGGAIGAALSADYIYYKTAREVNRFYNTNLGPSFNENEILDFIQEQKIEAKKFEDIALYEFCANEINAGKVVGWFQGRAEFGPRALGNRSILADPRNAEMQQKINLKIKNREGFRPFAPIVLEEDLQNYFDLETNSPFMLLVGKVNENIKKVIPCDFEFLEMKEKLNFMKSEIPAVTHVDLSCRVQTVNLQDNPKMYHLLKAFKSLTQCSVLINTSFNVRDEPPVLTPKDAYQCFIQTDMDLLVLGNYIILKNRN